MGKHILADEIRSRLDIVELVGEYLSLKRVGRNYVALCPFHAERTPSFTVSPDKQIFYCFGCGEGGDVIKFVMLMEDLSYFEALRVLASRIGIDFEERDLVETEGKALRLKNLHAELRLIFSRFLKSEVGRKAREYLKERGISAYYWEMFGLGYCPDGTEVSEMLIKSGFNKGDLIDSGLFGVKDGELYPKFKRRIMIPITDYSGQVVAFGGRVVDNLEEPKYLNSPETLIYKKGRYLFGWVLAREGIRKRDRVILVEGYMDVISMHAMGFTETVASLGTSLTKEQAKKLVALTRNVYIMYDGDSAGVNASLRASRILYALGIEPKIVKLPQEEDPDTLVRKSPQMVEELIVNSMTPIDLVVESGVFAKKDIMEKILDLLEEVEDPILVEEFAGYIASRLGIQETYIRLALEERKSKLSRRMGKKSSSSDDASGRGVVWEKALLKWCVDDPSLLEVLGDKILEVDFKDPLVAEVLPGVVREKDVTKVVLSLSEDKQKEMFSVMFGKERFMDISEVLAIFERKWKRSRMSKLKNELKLMDKSDERFHELFKIYKELAKGGNK
ncbi:MAG: DNA primase [Thermosulfidibacteraceae bacterium]|jgi:DNA primase